MRVFLPGSCLGILGGGQLGMMLAREARRSGYRTVIWTGGTEAPAARFADIAIEKCFSDETALAEFLHHAEFATVEFENIPVALLERIEEHCPLSPSPEVIGICQRRDLEKAFLQEQSIPCAPFAIIRSAGDLKEGVKRLGFPVVLKTAAFGYDGKGQQRLNGDEDLDSVWARFATDVAVLEGWITFDKELSLMVARDVRGNVVVYDPAENAHRHHVLDYSIIPARVGSLVLEEARAIAVKIVEALGYQGILGIEFFLASSGELLVNELAPRPHNSGHHTLDACVTSQFDQQLRAVAGLALGSPQLLAPAVMLNLLSDMWSAEGEAPDWSPVFENGRAMLHLYGKGYAPGRRKLGHLNLLGGSQEPPLAEALALKDLWLTSEI